MEAFRQRLTAAGYARQSITSATFWTDSTFTNGDPCEVNAAALTFGTPSGVDWGYVNELCLYDGSGDTTPAKIFRIGDGTGASVVYLRDGVEVRFEIGEIILFASNAL